MGVVLVIVALVRVVDMSVMLVLIAFVGVMHVAGLVTVVLVVVALVDVVNVSVMLVVVTFVDVVGCYHKLLLLSRSLPVYYGRREMPSVRCYK